MGYVHPETVIPPEQWKNPSSGAAEKIISSRAEWGFPYYIDLDRRDFAYLPSVEAVMPEMTEQWTLMSWGRSLHVFFQNANDAVTAKLVLL